MSDVVLKVENLYKRYRLGNVDRSAFKEDLVSGLAKLLGRPDPYEKYVTSNQLSAVKSKEELEKMGARYVWALQDINFEVKRGEILGVIGKNGAGKSTLLKILSKTTAPTKGQVKINGRIASLLEVGTGFHGDLTGRENIFLNGSILGMNRHEIRRKLDEITDFAGVEAFLDTPVKRYSSGMYVRLAFAVAAHLDPDILIVDEVLAVGDAEFQKKCIGKMKSVSTDEGRTVLFVSHNMATISSLCSHGIVLQSGNLVLGRSDVKRAITYYNEKISHIAKSTLLADRTDRDGNALLKFKEVEILNENNQLIKYPVCGQAIVFRLHYQAYQSIRDVSIALGFYSMSGDVKVVLWTNLLNANYNLSAEEGILECQLKRFPLSPGTYFVNIFSQSNGEILDWVQEALIIEVQDGDYYGSGKLLNASHQGVLVEHSWS
jgi:lipopolysaccharide transport system ATP-binding protein